MPASKFKRWRTALFGGCAGLLVGCSTVFTERLYDGERPLDQVAVIVWAGPALNMPRFVRVDGKELPGDFWGYLRAELLPGEHEFVVRALGTKGPVVGRDGSLDARTTMFSIKHRVEAGRCYSLDQKLLREERNSDEYGQVTVIQYYADPVIAQVENPDPDGYCFKREALPKN